MSKKIKYVLGHNRRDAQNSIDAHRKIIHRMRLLPFTYIIVTPQSPDGAVRGSRIQAEDLMITPAFGSSPDADQVIINLIPAVIAGALL